MSENCNNVSMLEILAVEPGKLPELRSIPHTLQAMQALVGGSIQAVHPFDEPMALICNEEGKLEGLPPNRGLWDEDGTLYDVVCGTFFLCATPPDEDIFRSLMEEQARRYQERFARPEIFLLDGRTTAGSPCGGCSMIRRLYEGGLDPSAQDLRREPGYRDAMENLLEVEEFLRKSLPMDQCSVLEKLSSAYIEL